MKTTTGSMGQTTPSSSQKPSTGITQAIVPLTHSQFRMLNGIDASQLKNIIVLAFTPDDGRRKAFAESLEGGLYNNAVLCYNLMSGTLHTYLITSRPGVVEEVRLVPEDEALVVTIIPSVQTEAA